MFCPPASTPPTTASGEACSLIKAIRKGGGMFGFRLFAADSASGVPLAEWFTFWRVLQKVGSWSATTLVMQRLSGARNHRDRFLVQALHAWKRYAHLPLSEKR